MNIITNLYILFSIQLLFDLLNIFFVSSLINKQNNKNNILTSKNFIHNYTFLLNNEDWTIEGNQHKNIKAYHIPHTYNREMSRFIIGNDTIINVNSRGDNNDKSLWYFRSPFLEANLSNYKYINFSLSCFSGISNLLNRIDHYIRVCNEKIGLCAKYIVLDKFNFTAQWTKFTVFLDKKLWTQSKKINEIFNNVSYIYILGDWTQWYETIGLDNFFIR